jgi:uncharacterized protein
LIIDEHAPKLWILTAGRVGDLKQMRVLAQVLRWRTEEKHLAFSSLALSSWPRLAPRLLTAAAQASLTGVLPDVVLAAESRAAAVALSLKARSRGKTKAVCIGRPRGRHADFDLIVTTPQYELQSSANVIEITLPLTDITLEKVAERQPSPTRPKILLLVGGTSPPFQLDAHAARRLAQDAHEYAVRRAGTLFVSTSARTGIEAETAISSILGAEQRIFLWSRARGANPYREFMAAADECVVTADSISMIADAIKAGKPTLLYRLPEHWSARQAWVQRQWRAVKMNRSWWSARLFDEGLLESRADRMALNSRLVESGLASWFGERPTAPKGLPNDLHAVAERVKALVPVQSKLQMPK